MVYTYDQIAGQLIADGIQSGMPLTGFETNQSIGSIKVNSLIPKLNVFIKDTKVWGNPLSVLENRRDNKFGGGMEQGAFLKAANNQKLAAGMFPYGSAEMVSQVIYDNYAYNIPISVVDDEVDQAVFNAEQAGAYAANKVMTAAKAIGQHGYAAYKRLLANVVDGTNTFTTKDDAWGDGSSVTYAKTVVGYAGKTLTPDIIMAAPTRAATSAFASDAAALSLAQLLVSVQEDFTYEGTDFNLAGIETFTMGKPNLIMETKWMTAMDNAFMMNAGFKGFPTTDARTFLKGKFNVVEIDAFPAKPVTDPVTTTRVGAIIADPGLLIRANRREDVESTRDGPHRSTGYSYQCKALVGIDTQVNSCAVLVKVS